MLRRLLPLVLVLGGCDSEEPFEYLAIPDTIDENKASYRLNGAYHAVHQSSPDTHIEALAYDLPHHSAPSTRRVQVSIRNTLNENGAWTEYEAINFTVDGLPGRGTYTVRNGGGVPIMGYAILKRLRCPTSGLCDTISSYPDYEWTLNVVRYDDTGLAAEFSFEGENREGEVMTVEDGQIEVRFATQGTP